ncbi:MAG: hypothetical protein FJ144_24475 [Deltaproteobacteria bacterium]|nr:hypothetical protein [Deltaproteobacteria bacterium]
MVLAAFVFLQIVGAAHGSLHPAKRDDCAVCRATRSTPIDETLRPTIVAARLVCDVVAIAAPRPAVAIRAPTRARAPPAAPWI